MFDDPVFMGVSIGVSIAVFLGSLIAIPIVLIKMPEDYLVHPPKKSANTALKIGKNVLGVALLAIGVALLILPGQGVLMIIVGLLLVDFPGRQKLLRKLMAKPKVQKAITAIRKRAGKPPLQIKQNAARA
jgi:hypothetical protein